MFPDPPAAPTLSGTPPVGLAERPPLDRAGQIVAAAYALLDEAGLEGLTIRAVLTRTGLARRAFYDRFAGKDDLVLAVFADTLDQAARRLGEQMAGLPDPLARLRHIVISIVLGQALYDQGAGSARRRGAALSREHLRLAESRPVELQKAIAPVIGLIAAQLADGAAAGRMRGGSPQRLATLVYNLVSTTVHAELLAGETAPPDAAHRTLLAEDIWEFCRRAVAA
ncbi:MAG: helix-turn-helix domain-containing protein [Sphingomonas sp.]